MIFVQAGSRQHHYPPKYQSFSTTLPYLPNDSDLFNDINDPHPNCPGIELDNRNTWDPWEDYDENNIQDEPPVSHHQPQNYPNAHFHVDYNIPDNVFNKTHTPTTTSHHIPSFTTQVPQFTPQQVVPQFTPQQVVPQFTPQVVSQFTPQHVVAQFKTDRMTYHASPAPQTHIPNEPPKTHNPPRNAHNFVAAAETTSSVLTRPHECVTNDTHMHENASEAQNGDNNVSS